MVESDCRYNNNKNAKDDAATEKTPFSLLFAYHSLKASFYWYPHSKPTLHHSTFKNSLRVFSLDASHQSIDSRGMLLPFEYQGVYESLGEGVLFGGKGGGGRC